MNQVEVFDLKQAYKFIRVLLNTGYTVSMKSINCGKNSIRSTTFIIEFERETA